MFRDLFVNFLRTASGYILLLLAIWLLGAIIGYYQQQPIKIEPGSYLALNLDSAIAESPNEAQRSLFQTKSITLRQILKSIEYAGTVQELKGIVLNGSFSASTTLSWAAAEELRKALNDFKKTGKDIQAYTTSLDEKSYYVLSTANKLIVHPQADIVWNGIGADVPFVKNLLNKIGVEVEVVRAGKYKSYGDFLTRTTMSVEDREQMMRLVNNIWQNVKVAVVENRKGITEQELDRIANEEGILSAERGRELGLVDGIAFWNDFKNSLGVKDDMLVKLSGFRKNVAKAQPAGTDNIAILYCDGELLRDDAYADVVESLRKIQRDKNLKGLIVRINSPGGAIVPASTIAGEIEQIKKKVPVMISMGGVAASGGYWIASSGTQVWADEMTITGSIGVVGIFPSMQKLASTLGVNFDRIETGPLATIGSVTTPLNENSRSVLSKMVANSYEDFLTKVAKNRKMDMNGANEVAQGRVWMGNDAQQKNLVDNIGGLLAVEKHMLAIVGKNANIQVYPEADGGRFFKRLFKTDQADEFGINIGNINKRFEEIKASGPMWAIGPMWRVNFN